MQIHENRSGSHVFAQNYLKVVSYKAKGCGNLILNAEMNSVRTSRRNGVHTSTINTSGGTIL